MHDTAMKNGGLFFKIYIERITTHIKIVDIGSRDVNGTLRNYNPSSSEYIGVDFEPGKGVDVILTDPYHLPFDDASVDFVVSSSCFEHSEMFWLTFLEISRVLKSGGLFYLNAPSSCGFHRYPVDCYRFFPDSGNAMAKWAKRSGYDVVVLEHYTNHGDYVCVFLKDEKMVTHHPDRMIYFVKEFSCGCIYPNMNEFLFPKGIEGLPRSHWAPQLKMPGILD